MYAAFFRYLQDKRQGRLVGTDGPSRDDEGTSNICSLGSSSRSGSRVRVVHHVGQCVGVRVCMYECVFQQTSGAWLISRTTFLTGLLYDTTPKTPGDV